MWGGGREEGIHDIHRSEEATMHASHMQLNTQKTTNFMAQASAVAADPADVATPPPGAPAPPSDEEDNANDFDWSDNNEAHEEIHGDA